ncbi:hypothetical protein GN956_G1372 [Arapaima gigas]
MGSWTITISACGHATRDHKHHRHCHHHYHHQQQQQHLLRRRSSTQGQCNVRRLLFKNKLGPVTDTHTDTHTHTLLHAGHKHGRESRPSFKQVSSQLGGVEEEG